MNVHPIAFGQTAALLNGRFPPGHVLLQHLCWPAVESDAVAWQAFGRVTQSGAVIRLSTAASQTAALEAARAELNWAGDMTVYQVES
jgi:hypothetical protein